MQRSLEPGMHGRWNTDWYASHRTSEFGLGGHIGGPVTGPIKISSLGNFVDAGPSLELL